VLIWFGGRVAVVQVNSLDSYELTQIFAIFFAVRIQNGYDIAFPHDIHSIKIPFYSF